MTTVLAVATDATMQGLAAAAASLLMVVAGRAKGRLEWRPPDRPRRRRSWFRGGGRPRSSSR